VSSLVAVGAALCLSVVVFGCAVALVVLAVAPLARAAPRLLAGAPPARRAGIAVAAAVAPTVVPLAAVLLCLAPGLPALLGLGSDHCLHHLDHPHLCLAHATVAPTPGLLGSAALVLVACAALGARPARAIGRAATRAARLARLPAEPLAPDVRCVTSRRPFSITTGWLRPRIVASTALVGALSPADLEAVIAHERAHARRRDPLRRSLAALLSFPLPRGGRRRLLAELELASEQACDEEAARRVGDRLQVAEAILAVERLVGHGAVGPETAGAGFGDGVLEARVRALAVPAPPGSREPSTRRNVLLAGVVLVVVVVMAAGALPLHHAVEHALQLVLHAH